MRHSRGARVLSLAQKRAIWILGAHGRRNSGERHQTNRENHRVDERPRSAYFGAQVPGEHEKTPANKEIAALEDWPGDVACAAKQTSSPSVTGPANYYQR